MPTIRTFCSPSGPATRKVSPSMTSTVVHCASAAAALPEVVASGVSDPADATVATVAGALGTAVPAATGATLPSPVPLQPASKRAAPVTPPSHRPPTPTARHYADRVRHWCLWRFLLIVRSQLQLDGSRRS